MIVDVESVLQTHIGLVHLGEGTDGAAPSALPINREKLAADLQRVTRGNEKYFQVAVGMAILIFVLGCALVFAYRNTPALIGVIFTSSGISVGGASVAMLGFWREKVRSDTLLILIPVMSSEDLRAALMTMFAALQKK